MVLHDSVWQYITKNKGYIVSEKNLHKNFAHIMFDPCKVCHCLKCSICTDQNFMQKFFVCVFFLFFQKQWVPCFCDIRPYAAVSHICATFHYTSSPPLFFSFFFHFVTKNKFCKTNEFIFFFQVFTFCNTTKQN